MNVLIVDDHAQNRYLLKSLLAGHGYGVAAAGDGAEALELLRQGGHDAVVADLLMPKMDGFELLRRMRDDATLRRLPFVVYTATYTSAADEHLARKLGADAYFVKPMPNEEFLAGLARVLQEHARRPAAPPDAAAEPAGSADAAARLLQLHNETLIAKLEKKIHDLEAARAAAARSETRFQAAARMAPVGLVQVAPDQSVTFVNDAWRRLAGAAADAPSWLDAAHPDDRPDLAAAWTAAFAAGQAFTAEFRLAAAPGQAPRRVRAQGAPFADADGAVLGHMVVVDDLTEIRALEAERRALGARVERAARLDALGGFLAKFGAELGELRHQAAAHAELAAAAPDAGTQTAEFAALAATLERMDGLARQLQGFARPDAARFVPTGLADLVRQELAACAAAAGVPGHVAAPEPLPEVLCDLAQLQPALRRLFAAAAAVGELSARLVVVRPAAADLDRCPALRDQDYVCLALPAPPPAAGREVDWGLELAQAAALAHGGALEWPGADAVAPAECRWWLPAYRKARPPSDPPRLARMGRGERVLVVDANPAALAVTRRMLDRLGYAAAAYDDVAAALAAFEERPSRFDLALLAPDLPGGGAQAFAAALWKKRPGIPIAAIVDESDPAAARDLRFVATVVKPFGTLGLAVALGRAFAAEG